MGTPLTEERFIELFQKFGQSLEERLDKKFDDKLKPINDILNEMTKFARIKNDSTIGYLPRSYIVIPCPSK
jgi:hypothetical protein